MIIMNNYNFNYDIQEQLFLDEQVDYDFCDEKSHNQDNLDLDIGEGHEKCDENTKKDLTKNDIYSLSAIYAKRNSKTITNELQVDCQRYYETFCNETEVKKVSRGRRKAQISTFFNKFETWDPKKDSVINKKAIKREYFNANIYRSFCKAVRCALKGSTPKGNKLAFNYHDITEMKIWRSFSDFVSQNLVFFELQSKPETFPSGNKSRKSSFNLDLMNEFFGNHINRAALDILIKLFFENISIERLQKIFRMSCCKKNGKEVHDFSCYIKWGLLQKLLENEFYKAITN
ncbi:hypothetical protein SteCoe_10102 [Stentor coeruleus]|uniref:Uncharacterized protein n=1 Tax=Stentor coeruleus TaxID=5963 RepID=A0A1R2CG83_9CILI|nr:hypothetical protein SteCoe_10102 [Stentor coeruleus]